MITELTNITYKPLVSGYFEQVIRLANQVHGAGYLNTARLAHWLSLGCHQGENCSYIALQDEQLIAFRITFSPTHWPIDKWCSPQLWQIDSDKCCYFKCNTVAANYRGLGIGKQLLQLSIQAAKKQGAQAGIAHLWQQSPNNSAVAYFSHCGGKPIKNHPDKWNEESQQGYDCILCGHDCHCEAAEMIIYF